MSKKIDRTLQGRAPNAGRNLHEQDTKILKRPSAETVRVDASKPRRRASGGEVADAIVQFRESDAAERWRASTAPTKTLKRP